MTHYAAGTSASTRSGLPDPHQQLATLDPQRRKRMFCDNPDRVIKET